MDTMGFVGCDIIDIVFDGIFYRVALFVSLWGLQVYNLCSERTYDHAKFHNRVLHFPLYVTTAAGPVS